MYFRSFLATLFLAGAVVAGPIRQADRGLGSTVGSVTGNLDGNKAEGNGNGNEAGNGNGNGNEAGTGNSAGDGNEANNNDVLSDIGNISFGETSKQIAEDVMASIKTLSMSCMSDQSGGMRCTWS